MKALLILVVVVALAALPLSAGAQGVADKLGEDYKKAGPGGKLLMLAVARQDQVVNYQDSQKEVDDIFLTEVNKGKSSEEKLKTLGALRKELEEKIKVKAEERKKAGMKTYYVGGLEPDMNLQAAIADSYVADTAGAKPSLQALECLALVRSCTSWSTTASLTLALVTEALYRDEAFLKADSEGKLKIIKTVSEEKQMLSNLEQTYLEKAVVSEWMNGLLKSGKSPKDVRAEVDKLAKSKAINFFTSSWAQGILDGMAKIR